MVDVGRKAPTERRAVAEACVELPGPIYEAIKRGGLPKGDPISIAELGGIMGAKRTSELIPLCHGVKLDSVRVKCELSDTKMSLRIECEASSRDVTGVEMEALTGVAVASLVFYDMCKGIDKGMIISNIRLLEKTGGKSGTWRVAEQGEI
jgi:cyclic pyranopterin phosphate synthase